ncbi:hypothetical protein [Cellulomonas edaphi]|uniref:Uncharacterized protein n=1 Tax=Cellulomonas edaphi TaxID=3053468 RepID=A0ABT7S672_9CELL|nr:hypothetical protein [Cellulomons edaphi]MDM7831113.1 hypothetical protein [Cellulomons edaphi]
MSGFAVVQAVVVIGAAVRMYLRPDASARDRDRAIILLGLTGVVVGMLALRLSVFRLIGAQRVASQRFGGSAGFGQPLPLDRLAYQLAQLPRPSAA